MNNKSLLGSDAGKGVAPWECVPRHTRAGVRSRGLRSKAWTGRGPGGRRFLLPCKNLRHPRTSHERHPIPACERPTKMGCIPSRKQTAGRETGDIHSRRQSADRKSGDIPLTCALAHIIPTMALRNSEPLFCGEREIRTPEAVTRLAHFECAAIVHSATSPMKPVQR